MGSPRSVHRSKQSSKSKSRSNQQKSKQHRESEGSDGGPLLLSDQHSATTRSELKYTIDWDRLDIDEQRLVEDAWSTAEAYDQDRARAPHLFLDLIRMVGRQLIWEWDHFFHSRTYDLWVGGLLLRVGVAGVTLLNIWNLWEHVEVFFGYLVPYWPVGNLLMGPGVVSVFPTILPKPDPSVADENPWDRHDPDFASEQMNLFFRIWGIQCCFLLLGICLPRFHAICNFVYWVSLQNHDTLLWDSADTVVRLLSFFLIFLPVHSYSLWDLLNWTSTPSPLRQTWPMWPFRLVQIQMCIIYVSTFLSKWMGSKWKDGTALYYIVQTDDVYGKWFHPSMLFGHMGSLRMLTHSTLVLEGLAPIALWFPPTRKIALILVVLFHLGIDASMNLGTFHLAMIVGFFSFLVKPGEVVDDSICADEGEASDTDVDYSKARGMRAHNQKKKRKVKQKQQ